jgi:hypothetical protein
MTRILIGALETIGGRPMTWIIFRAAVSNADPEKNDGGKANAEKAGSGSARGPACALMMIANSIVRLAGFCSK